jgi:hypothetical protein
MTEGEQGLARYRDGFDRDKILWREPNWWVVGCGLWNLELELELELEAGDLRRPPISSPDRTIE